VQIRRIHRRADAMKFSSRISKGRRRDGESKTPESLICVAFSGFPPFFRDLFKDCQKILAREDEILIGFVPRNSRWAKFFCEKRRRGSLYCRCGRFYSLEEIERLLIKRGFSLQGVFSTLFQGPGELKCPEKPLKGYYPQASFLVLIGQKIN